MAGRPDKVAGAAEAIAALLPEAGGGLVAVGGMHMHNNPMALVRALVEAGRPLGRLLTSPSAGLAADVLIGSGLVAEVATSYVGFEHLGLAPRFRRAVETGSVRVLELDEASITHGLYAGAGGLPYIPLPSGLELSDVSRVNGESYALAVDPFTGEPHLAVRALRPDLALVHAAVADARGNAAFQGAWFTDRLMALAARRVIVQVERLVPNSEIAARPAGSTLPGFLVDAVVVAPGGCRPTASHGEYPYDEAALREYLRTALEPVA